MTTIKINGRNCRELADEFARIVGKSAHFNMYGYRLEFEMDDAEALVRTAEDAARYWQSRGKRAMAQAADTVRELIRAEIISESARLSWQPR